MRSAAGGTLSMIARRLTCFRRSLAARSDGAGDAGSLQAAVSTRVLRQVLLVVLLGVVELGRRSDLGADLATARAAQRRLVRVARRAPLFRLPFTVREDAGAVLGADVVPLAHPL